MKNTTAKTSVAGLTKQWRTNAALGACIAALAGLALGACSSGTAAAKGSGRTLSAADFASGNGSGAAGISTSAAGTTTSGASQQAAAPAETTTSQAAPTTPAQGRVLATSDVTLTGPMAASEGVTDTTTITAGEVNATPVGNATLIDAKVGDVNGKPIFASAVFDRGTLTQEAMGSRLAAEAKRIPPERWRGLAREAITRWIDAFIEDELLRAEALGSLTTEQQQGLFAFIEGLQRDLQREQGGSRAQLERNLQDTKGLTIDQWRRRQEDVELVRAQLIDRVYRRVNVGTRDIRQRYFQLFDEYNRPPLATFRLVVVAKENQAAVDGFAKELAEAANFAAAAESRYNLNKRDKGGLEPRDLSDDPAKLELFATEKLNAVARTITVGETVGPIEDGPAMLWLHLESVEDRKRSLYDAQLEVEDRVRGERAETQRKRYIDTLRSRASISDVSDMVDALMEVAEKRYLPARPARP
ncbi:MAG TPA: hypothetical protein VK157_04850 [Phycisphaerales bacterium]|nr:hypothetical protein [Phycisphaerales bacterium]